MMGGWGYPYGSMMGGYGSWMGVGFAVFIFLLLLGLGAVLLAVWATRRSHHTMMAGHGMMAGGPPMSPPSTPVDPALTTARERLARGEITVEEYETIVSKLRGS